ncbi:TRAP-type mannitol/chloroaromatic compound transport system, small permease component [Hartmannibacter diazotrophicus]|uniref:TRAP transporter small permease protein n=1 Tax=Hartmannibacter diazotrophicus TaxID=1482074 RepID=A0A2C9DE76_9HYPH|nr:TRAP transporter small permease subunit [Hartmannibacter diazotrophicus]SON58131.1 TRAP-type mannitol/chloroaromatic compound transport system, small permease component [Hartmannibacter diazotrophicus]
MMRLARGADSFVRVVGQVMAWSGLAMVLVVAFDVIARYLFSYGTVALQELEWHLMAVAALFGMSYGLNRGEEVRVDILYANYPERLKLAIDFLSAILLTAVALTIAWLAIKYVQQSYALGEGSPDPGGLPDRWILKAAIPVSFLLLALQSAARAVMTASQFFSHARPDAGPLDG